MWAIGDCVRGPMLAHKASEEGIAVAERIAGQQPHVDFNLVPWIIYTWPEIAWVGQTEDAAKQAGASVRVGSFPFMASGRARAMGEAEGFVKVISDAKTGEIYGVHIIGSEATELIAEYGLAMNLEATVEEIHHTIHAHPTLSEALAEAAAATTNEAIHI